MQNLKDSLRQLQKGSPLVSDYSRKFKSICDQLAAIGQPVDTTDKTHCFFQSHGPSFETFSIAHKAITPRPSFRYLVAQAEIHELFVKSLHGPNSHPPPVAFNVHQNRFSPTANRGSSSRGGRGGRSGGWGRGRRPPHYQLRRKDGHYASQCPGLPTFAKQSVKIDANLAHAFTAKCNVDHNCSDWYVDTGASAHMTPEASNLTNSAPCTGNEHVAFCNGNILNISRIGNASITKDINLADVLVIPKLTKNLISISKLTSDSPVNVLFSNNQFAIQKRKTKEVLAKGRVDQGLYVLEHGHEALISHLNSTRVGASYKLWHSRLGHVAFSTISNLHKLGHLFVTSVLPKPGLCSSCEISKSHKLSFPLNEK